MNNFFEEFKVQLKEAIIEDYKSLLKLSDGEKAYACALVTDSDAITLFFAMNTIEKYSQKLIEVGNEYQSYYKWAPSEWAYGDHLSENKKISQISDILTRQRETIKDDVSDFEINLYESITSTLKTLINDGYFSNMIVFISISDDERSKSIENYSAKLLNIPEKYNEFLNR